MLSILVGAVFLLVCSAVGIAGIHFDQTAPAAVAILFLFLGYAAIVIGNSLKGDPLIASGQPSGWDTWVTQRMTDSIKPYEKLTLILEEWKHITSVQMHFNEMIIRMRTLAVSVIITVFGAGGFAIARFRGEFIRLFGQDIHISAFVVLFGLVLCLSIFVMDYWYYYKMLVGAVRRGYRIERAFAKSKAFGDTRFFGAAGEISAAIGPSGFSKIILWTFYGIVYLFGLAFLVSILILIKRV